MMVAFIGYLSSFFDPIQQLSQLYSTFQAAMAALEKIFGVLDTEPEIADAPGRRGPAADRGARCELSGVTLRLRPHARCCTSSTWSIPAGETVALVGTHRRRAS